MLCCFCITLLIWAINICCCMIHAAELASVLGPVGAKHIFVWGPTRPGFPNVCIRCNPPMPGNCVMGVFIIGNSKGFPKPVAPKPPPVRSMILEARSPLGPLCEPEYALLPPFPPPRPRGGITSRLYCAYSDEALLRGLRLKLNEQGCREDSAQR